MKKIFEKILKDSGLKITKNRIAILNELNKKQIPLTAEEIYNSLSHSKTEKYSISSIYRALMQFSEKNIVKKTAQIDAITYYQLITGHTHSLICEKCKKIIPINHCPIHTLIKDIEEKTEFLITGHHLEIKGICKSCKEKLTKDELKEINEIRKEEISHEHYHKCKDENCV